MNSGGSRSGRVDRICPSLQNVGPSSSSASRRRLALRARPTVPSSSGRPNSSFRPCFAKTVAIFEPARDQVRLGLRHRCAGAQRDAARGAPGIAVVDAVGRVDDDHRAAGVVADPVRHVAEQELLAPGHPGVADHEHVDRARRRRRRRSPSRGPRRRRRARGRASPARRSASAARASAAAAACVRSAAPNSVSDGLPGTITCTRWSSAPNRSAKSLAHPTARDAVWERSVPTITRWIEPVDAGRCAHGRIMPCPTDPGKGGLRERSRGGGGTPRRLRAAPSSTEGDDDRGDRSGRRHRHHDAHRRGPIAQPEPGSIGDRARQDQAREADPDGSFHQRGRRADRGRRTTRPPPRRRPRAMPAWRRRARQPGRRLRGGLDRGHHLGRRPCRRERVSWFVCHKLIASRVAVGRRRVAHQHVANTIARHRRAQEVDRPDHLDRGRATVRGRSTTTGPAVPATAGAHRHDGRRRRVGVRPGRPHPQPDRARADRRHGDDRDRPRASAGPARRSRASPIAASSGRQNANATIRCGGNAATRGLRPRLRR